MSAGHPTLERSESAGARALCAGAMGTRRERCALCDAPSRHGEVVIVENGLEIEQVEDVANQRQFLQRTTTVPTIPG